MRPSHRLLTISAPLLLLLVLPLAAQAQSFCDFAPAVDVSATRGAVGVPVLVEVKASDPNGDAITSLTADTSALPPGNNAVFTANASNTAGTLTWTPQAGQTGTFTVTYTAGNALSGSKSATINVVDTAGAPFAQCPTSITAWGGANVTFDVYAGDPDGEPIASLTASPMPIGATFTVDPGNAHAVFSWTPGFSSSGATITFTATNSLTGSSSTLITVPKVDRVPVVNAPPSATGTELTLLSICASAFDPDGDAIISLTASGTAMTAGGVFTASAGNTSGTFNWTPTRGQAGSYSVTFTASNALSGTAATPITINPAPDRPPVVSAPANRAGNLGFLLSFTVSASDPDGDAISSLTAAPLPAGATFTANASNTTGTFSWTPSFTQAGSYNVTFTAANALSGSATTTICAGCGDHAPVVTAPATASGAVNVLLTFTVSAIDGDGDAITSLAATGLPPGATFTVNPSNTSGTFSWTPGVSQAGTFLITFTASNALTGSATTAITIGGADRPPVVTAPATVSANANTLLTFTVFASDPDGDAISTLTAAPLPSGATFTANASQTSGTFSWTPTCAQAGSYSVTFTAANALSGSAATAITIACGTGMPVVTAPATASVNENVPLTFTVSASTGGGGPITSLTASPLPRGATFTADASNTSGTFTWLPNFTQAGSYNVTFTAVNSFSIAGSASTAITVFNVDRTPVVTAPPFASGAENALMTFIVLATDPDGDAITSLTAAPLPAGATFTANASNTSGTFSWTPSFTQAGSYSVTFTAANALIGSATTMICAGCSDRAPVVTAPAFVTGFINTLLAFQVTAADPDGDAITSLTALSLPLGATFTPNASNTQGSFIWPATFVQPGTFTVTFIAANALSGSANTVICVGCADRPPVVVAPASLTEQATLMFSFTVSATDPDGDAITSLTAGLPPGATFTVNGTNTSGTFSWTPTLAQVGSYLVTFTAANALSGSATTSLAITRPGDNPPVVSAPASATGVEGTLLAFTVTASDPDGDPITSLTAAPLPSGAVFVANGSNTSGSFSWTPATGQAGTYFVTFRARNLLSGGATTAINITADLAARIFTTGGDKTIKLSSNRAVWCAEIEPVNGDFAVTDVIPSSVVMISPGTGSVGQISAGGKTAVVGDQDNNGIEDLEVCFLKGDLRLLFSNLSGKQTVTVTLEGNLITGSRFHGSLTVDVNAGGGGGGALAASVARDVSGGGSTLFFTTTRAGAVRVRVFDVSGRMVRSLVEDSYRSTGLQTVRFDGRADDGRRLASGIYLFRIEAAEGIANGRFAVLR